MKKFFIKGFLFCTMILFICGGVIISSAKEPARSSLARWTDSTGFMGSNEMLPYIAEARNPDGTTQLLIGDSIGRQLFIGLAGQNPQADILASNAAFMITGQYLLAEEYLKYHPDATDVFLVMHPLPLTRTFDTEWSYRYAVMTYVETDTIGQLDSNTLDVMEDIYGSLFLQKKVVQLIEDSPICRKLYLSYINLNREDYIQRTPFELADQYVKKLYQLCEQNGVRLHVHSAPVAEYFREQVEELEKAYEGTWMSSQYPDYFNEILYYPSEWTEDMSHFCGEYAEREHLNEIIRKAYGETVLSEEIKGWEEP